MQKKHFTLDYLYSSYELPTDHQQLQVRLHTSLIQPGRLLISAKLPRDYEIPFSKTRLLKNKYKYIEIK